MKTILTIAALAACFAGPVAAASAVGVWLTQPDAKGQTALVSAQACGGALCGTITQVMNPAGAPIPHPNVGRRVFWDMKKVTGDTYAGRAYVPAFRRDYDAEMKVSGQRMTVRGCLGPVCKNQVWTRVK